MLREIIKHKDSLHHAYLIESDSLEIVAQIINLFEDVLKFSTKNNPDFWFGEFETFGIDDGRKINELQSKKSFNGGKQFFVIKMNFITREAQNSLLKMFEEPTPHTHFFIIMNSSEILLPTLKSRLMLVRPYSESDSEIEIEKFAKKFIKSSLAERLEMVKIYFGDSKKKEPADKSGAIRFLNELEKQLREDIDFKNVKEKDQIIFNEIMNCRSFLNDRSPSVKMLLEHISVIT
ncbi:TPA: hypothetical protein DCZ46_03280 [Candidatus Campbellbacteria bacterium]|nr:MAG: polymerase III subunit delta', DNA polymerase III subunit delta' protein [Candidatus Campbellbacteria bacterium GW2011_OD1_34_28]KKP74848.1 MAG: ATPase and helicase [Candidatus Campbellbacteria bacterium GW2011_GWD2_35_24]KKP75734.1 MAG: polymerase III subunit delta' protein [Candidatus Campbellbacteria bacterium GW2011_GWC2_35_28]KKP77018.1 MAG: ATPase and helicase [Candidatus Campbellbacteria bacterium GW2011_GWC1_35_31]KKP78944.1 MAG: ATPase and helicase [Candidatus Campbellbacteria 